jgi:type IV secretory pathway VirB4 component
VTNLRKAFQSYRSSGAFNELLAPMAFVADPVFLTKTGDLGMVLRLQGIDYECLTQELLEEQAKRFEAAMRSFDDQFRVYQYVLKRDGVKIPHKADYGNSLVNEAVSNRVRYLESKAEPLFELDLFLVVLLESKRFLTNPKAKVKATLQEALSNSKRLTLQYKELNRNIRFLQQRAAAFVTSTKDFIQPSILPKQDAFTFLRRLVNFTPGKAEAVRQKYNGHLDYFLCDSKMKVTESGLWMEGQHIHLYSLKEEPGSTHVNLLKSLHQLPCNVMVCSEFRRIPNIVMRARLRARQRHFDAQRFGFLALASKKPKDELKENESANESISELDEALKEIDNRGNYYGEFALTIALYSRDERQLYQAGAELTRIFGETDAAIIHETTDAPLVLAAILPGGTKWQHRKLSLLNLDYVNLGLFYAIHQGNKRNEYIGDEYLAVFETNFGTPFYFNLHTERLIGGLLFGVPDSGKSFTANYLITNTMKYNPRTLILDIGGSYRETTRNFGGTYAHLNLEDQTFRSNPYSLPATKDNLDFQTLFVRVLLEQSRHTVDSAEMEEVFQTTRRLYHSDPEHRTLGNLVATLPVALKRALQPWVRNGQNGCGQFGTVFDNVEDDLTLARFQCYDLKGMEKKGHLMQPFLFYGLHRFSAIVNDPAHLHELKVLWMDEAAQFFLDDVCRQYVINAGLTWRQQNGGIVLITQSAASLEASLEIINSVCPMKLFLADPGADREKYAKAFHLNAKEKELHATLTPKKQMLLKTPSGSKVLNLNVDPASYWLYTSSPREALRRQEVFAKYGPTRGLEILTNAVPEPERLAATA